MDLKRFRRMEGAAGQRTGVMAKNLGKKKGHQLLERRGQRHRIQCCWNLAEAKDLAQESYRFTGEGGSGFDGDDRFDGRRGQDDVLWRRGADRETRWGEE